MVSRNLLDTNLHLRADSLGGEETRLLGGDVAPLLDDGLLHLPGVLPRPAKIIETM